MRNVIKNDFGLDPDKAVLGEAFPIDRYRYDENAECRRFSDQCAWYFPVLDPASEPILGIFVAPNGPDRYMATLGGDFGQYFDEAASILNRLEDKAGGGSEVRGFNYFGTYAVHAVIGGEEKLVIIGDGIDKSYFEVTDHRQLPTLADFEKACVEEEENNKARGEIVIGGGSITLLPDLSKTFSPVIADPEPKIPTFILPAALGVLACAAVAGAVYSVKKQKKKAG
ncbi:MAG: hypothetical protein IJV00_06315 [Clostridia bacterium]|nr:hypothetical protein [Clostridia bacterium]